MCGRRRLARRNRHVDLLAGQRHRHRHRHHAIGFPGSLDRAFNAGTIAADHMRRTVDDHLRRVNVAIAARPRIGFLARAETGIGQRILPAEVIPIIDRHAQRDHVGIFREFANDLVGRRTG